MTISVALCTFNGARFLNEQLQSLAAQTRLPDELVVRDDASTDDTPAIVRAFARAAPFPVKWSRSERNQGSTANFAAALGECAGHGIALCDQDDIWRAEKLARLERALEENPRAGLAFSDAQIMDENGEVEQQRLWPLFDFEPRQNAPDFESLLQRNSVTGATTLLRAAYKPLLLPVPSGPLIHDAWFAALIAAVAQIVAVNEPLLLYRRHAGQQVGFQSAPAQAGTPVHYRDQLAQLEAMHARLRERGADFDDGQVTRNLSLLEARIAHLRARLGLPESKLARLPRVTRELLRGGYARYSNGWRSAAKDVLR